MDKGSKKGGTQTQHHRLTTLWFTKKAKDAPQLVQRPRESRFKCTILLDSRFCAFSMHQVSMYATGRTAHVNLQKSTYYHGICCSQYRDWLPSRGNMKNNIK